MDVLDAITNRRTIFRFKPEPLPRAVIERVFDYGRWAPNHHLTEPWRFIVLGEATKEKLARRYGEIQIERIQGQVDEAGRKKVGQVGYEKFQGKPTIVAVACAQDGDEIRNEEDFAATCCAMQNVQLAAWDAGVGMQWTTHPVTKEAATYRLLGLDPGREHVIGFFYMGYPDEALTKERKPLGEVLRYTP